MPIGLLSNVGERIEVWPSSAMMKLSRRQFDAVAVGIVGER
jgi:hypothetical protein